MLACSLICAWSQSTLWRTWSPSATHFLFHFEGLEPRRFVVLSRTSKLWPSSPRETKGPFVELKSWQRLECHWSSCASTWKESKFLWALFEPKDLSSLFSSRCFCFRRYRFCFERRWRLAQTLSWRWICTIFRTSQSQVWLCLEE